MAKSSNIYQIIFLFFLLITFVLGGYIYSTMDLKHIIAKMEGFEDGAASGKYIVTDVDGDGNVEKNMQIVTDSNSKSPSTLPVPATPEGCPDLLIQRGTAFFLYNTKLPLTPGANPMIFNSLEEYGTYFNSLKNTGRNCPPLFLQQENNSQGSDVYRIRPSPYNPFAGVPANSPLVQPYNGQIINELDASRDNGYNQNMYPGFDPDGLFIGRMTEIDQIHYSTENTQLSDNPMDSNWGGILHTQAQVDSGKYVENEVDRTNYATPKGAQMLPIYGPARPYP
jgi:hypothetical protein